nr:RluA family pseudouridine synthase [Candidatus Enterousia merdequi]
MAAEFITISDVDAGTRLLRWFLRNYPGMLQRDFYKLCRGGQIRINSSRCHGAEILSTGDVIRIPPTLSSYKKVNKTETGEKFSLTDLENLRQCIIHNDKDIVVFNKPAGLAVQGGTGIKKSIDKMAAALFPYDKISLVHRIDKETSGLLVVAKNQKAAQDLSLQFQNKTAHKEYLALLNGTLSERTGIIDNYVAKGYVFDDFAKIPKEIVAQRAITEYKVLSEASGLLSWVLFSPKTGRTHQLRLHSAFSLGAPIIGDDLYGYKQSKKNNSIFESLLKTQKLFLLAYRITFKHPGTGKTMTVRANVPDFMQSVIKFLELQLP